MSSFYNYSLYIIILKIYTFVAYQFFHIWKIIEWNNKFTIKLPLEILSEYSLTNELDKSVSVIILGLDKISC